MAIKLNSVLVRTRPVFAKTVTYVLDLIFVSTFKGEVGSYMGMPVQITAVNIIVMSVYIQGAEV